MKLERFTDSLTVIFYEALTDVSPPQTNALMKAHDIKY